jgi:mono/diheme cytochrome c family protein
VRGAFAAVLLALLATGCGSVAAQQEAGGGGNGEQLFRERCGQCHTLAAAGTRGTIGPNLDQAFADVRAKGFDETTIREVVRGQIAYPVSDPPTDAPGMPPEDELFEGISNKDAAADAVALFVAETAGKPGARPTQPAGGEAQDTETVFAQNCGGCHTLSKANTSGTVGPSLDNLSISVQQAHDQIANGGGGMPPFKDQLSEEQIQALAEYVTQR